METQKEKSIEVEGRNVEEALQAACDMLDTTPNQVDYEVCDEGRSGMLGFLKGKTYRIRVWKKSQTERMIRQLLVELFEHLGFEAELKITRAEDAYEIDIETDGADGLLIGRGGETLSGLQHLISRMVGHQDETVRVRVDVAGYRRRRHDQLRRKARDLAERARST
ncbi:MAG: KH domain-containing protein, partial [Candidatus Eisenbacteria bacterium]|nr:KH domain-containing protein [Candidatus Eisenbacteria bacterium]